MGGYLVVRLVPDAPVDGGTFSTYLDDLRLQVFDANTGNPVSDFVYSSPYVLTEGGGLFGEWISLATLITSTSTTYVSSGNYGTILTFDSSDGIPEGSYIFSADQTTIPPSAGLQVSKVTGNTVQLNNPLPNYVPTGTVVTFIAQSPSSDPTTATAFSFTLTTTNTQTIDGLAVLTFADVSGITVGMTVGGSPFIGVGANVAEVNASTNTVTLSQGFSGTPPAAISVSFTQNPPFAFFQLKPKSGAPAAAPTTLNFTSGGTNGVAVGMTLVPIPGLVAPGTVVTSVTSTAITLSQALLASIPSGQSFTFIFPLSSGIVQHTEVIGTGGFFGLQQLIGPASVATAIIPLFTPPPPPDDYLDVTIAATRASEVIPVNATFYNVLVSTSALPSTDQYQEIPDTQTSLYISLPPPAGANTVSVVLPSDGSPPPFDDLYAAINNALQNDPITSPPATIASLIASPGNCSRIAYDIVWSYQNALPAPPDPLESLYTNPPNPGGSADNSNNSTNSLETDRQKFEGTLNSFYSTRNATAERLTKFVAAASAAVVCEQASLNSAVALLEFPVDPSSSFATEVESELAVEGINASGPAGVNFGVPAAFFYALSANLDKSTTALQRFQQATGDAIDRLLQLFQTAENAGVIDDSENFTNPAFSSQSITSFQAARRLVALGVSAASNSASVTVFDGSPLAALIADWLATTDPTPTPPPNPPLTYQNTDFNIWTQDLASAEPTGYLYLDLDALTDGYVIPEFSATTITPSATATLTFLQSLNGPLLGLGVGMPVSGTNVPVGTTVASVSTVTTVTIAPGLSGAGVNPADTITFGLGSSAVSASPNQVIAAGDNLTFSGVLDVSVGMSVGGPSIGPSTTVTAVSAITTITLSQAPTGNVSNVTFNASSPTVIATTTADCPNATSVLTFAGSGTTTGIQPGMTVYGPNIPAGTVVEAPVSSPNVNIGNSVTADVPAGTVIVFATDPPPSLLADQIFQWLPSKTVQALKNVTAAQWTNFFTNVGNPTWLPPLTQPVAPGSSQPSPLSPGYVTARIKAFIRAVQLFFTVSSIPTSAQLPQPGAPPTFALPAYDPIGLASASLAASISGFNLFTTPFTAAELAAAVATVFPTDPAAQAWLTQTMNSISDLCQVASVVQNPTIAGGYTLPNPVSFAFSIAEALYARGFRRATDISNIPAADFQQALTGTVAYDYALSNGTNPSLYQQAQTISPPTTTPPGQTGGTFQPVNPDGSLVDCLPPPCLSPFSPIAYLQEMLQLSQNSTCENPWASPSPVETALGDAVTARRGPLGTLLASCANLETPLPLIDLVNESLEYLGATQPSSTQPPSGTVYNTSEDELAGYELCKQDDCKRDDRRCHEPPVVFGALPEYSTPATPVVGENDSVEPLVYNNLKTDFSSCCLPYSQALDVSRTYLRHLGSCRFEELRTFRKCITEFALDPGTPPAGFQSYLWRFPVRVDTAIEYLGITPEEYSTLFQGTPVQYCGEKCDQNTIPSGGTLSDAPAPTVSTAELYGYSEDRDQSWMEEVVVLSEFLKCTCLTYCEFLELSKVVWPQSTAGREPNQMTYPECEPCCLKDYRLQIPDDNPQQELLQLAIFIRLWRKLKEVCGARYSFQELYDICKVLELFTAAGTVNPEFIRQLAAFQMLRDYFKLPLVDRSGESTGTTGADRTHLLALWVGSGAKMWKWAVHQLLEGVEHYAKPRFGCARPRGESVAHMADNLDALSRLAGFNPPTSTSPSTDTWNSTPGCTLRFAEVLAKMCASRFRVGELLYLFNALPPHEYEDPFAQDAEEAQNFPLDLPEDGNEHSLWKLREELLRVEAGEEEAHRWTWPRIVAEFRGKFGYNPAAGQDPLLSIGQHFFPGVLEAAGYSVSGLQRQYRTSLTSTTSWNTPPGSPFQYDSTASQLWIQLPLRDEAVAAKLSQLPTLNGAEQAAVQDLYFAPRLDLASFAFLFPDWQSAEQHLIEEHGEGERWAYFRRHFALADARRKVIVKHLAKHVTHHFDCHLEELEEVAALVLSQLFSDENTGTPWESDTGAPPSSVMWTPPAGGAIPALLGLTGTGLLGEYLAPQQRERETQPPGSASVSNPGTNPVPNSAATPAGTPGTNLVPKPVSGLEPATQDIWREVRGPMEAFGRERDLTNSPVPTVIPSLALTPASSSVVAFTNGYAVRDSDGQRLGGAQDIQVRWSGVLLIEREGDYRFHAGAPAPHGEEPNFELAKASQWKITLKRGQKNLLVLNHQWPGETAPEKTAPRLRRGAYSIAIEYAQPAPNFAGPNVHPQHTGFQVKYAGPDTSECLITLPIRHLYRDYQDSTLDAGIDFLPGSKNAQLFLQRFYASTLRDMRRTYQRAFKAVLFCAKFALSARPSEDSHQSELGYMLANPGANPGFAGYAYYRPSSSSTTFNRHLANFDFNFLPLRDNYYQPTATPGDRSDPSLQRTQAMFDWWERIFDYEWMRREVLRVHRGYLWRLFEQAQVDDPANAADLLSFLGAPSFERNLELRFFQDQTSAIFTVGSGNLQDERWLIRVWHADRWLHSLLRCFHTKEMSEARPDLWAATDPGAPVPASGVLQTGNANLLAFLADGCIGDGEPRRYLDLKRVNDELREHGREALIAYLCKMDRVALPWSASSYATSARDLSDLLLLDVKTGICEKASRIEEAISAVQTFIRRCRLGLEPKWKVGRHFAQLWDSRFETYHIWERCKRREFYKENFIEWTEFGKARRIEAFRFLESQLRSSTLTLAAPGGLDYWQDNDKALEQRPELIQRVIPSELHALTVPPGSTTREGLGTLGNPDDPDQLTWLAAVPQASSSAVSATGGPSGTPSGGSSPAGAIPAASGSGGSLTGNSPSNPSTGVNPASAQAKVQSLAAAVAAGSSQPQVLPFWMESAVKMGTQFLRVAAAGVPQATLGFVPHGDEPKNTCCCECGREHPALVDEYYFWLVNSEFYSYTDDTDAQSSNPSASFTGSYQFGFQDSYYDPYQQQSAEWDDEGQVPALLAKWESNPCVRLAWCRVHDGEFGQPRKSAGYVAISEPADLVFLGRGGDSLYFQVSGSAPLPAGYGSNSSADTPDTSPPGFRFDLPWDEAVALPQPLAPPALPTPDPPKLLSYPFFAYDQPGARLFPAAWFAPSMLVGHALRNNCNFELALKWYERAFNPLRQDCAWMDCQGKTTEPGGDAIAKEAYELWDKHGRPQSEQTQDWYDAQAILKARAVTGGSTDQSSNQGACCDSSKVSDETARHRALTLSWCRTALEWGEALARHRRSPEAFEQARTLYDVVARVMGPRPRVVRMPEPKNVPEVTNYVPAYPPLNPRLMELYDLVADRLELIHHCFDSRRLRNGQLGVDMCYFGDNPLREGWRTAQEPCADKDEWCWRRNPYRFTAQIPKAFELAAKVREHGNALLAAYKDCDNEALTSIKAEQERELLVLTRTIRQDQWRDADWQVQALQQTKDVNQTNLLYYTNLYQNGLITDEIQNLSLSNNALQTRTAGNVTEAIGEAMHLVPDAYVGAMSTFTHVPIGDKLAAFFGAIAKIMLTVADIQSSTAAIDMTQATWQRRSAEWFNKMQSLPIEIQQTELQILGAHRRRDQAMQELNNLQRQIEHSTEVLDFLRDKFTATDLFLWLRKETLGLQRRLFKLAHRAALEAEHAFNFERGHTTRHFIPEDIWDDRRQGLLAGERLEAALHHMHKAYLDENIREYELTKHFSLRLHFPMEFLRLKVTGACEIELPEWMFDLDYPGHYMRRIKSLSLTIPCVTGPYTGVHCKVTLLSSVTRIDPRTEAPSTGCCCQCASKDGYEACAHDPRIVHMYGAEEAIATSNGQNDSGLFELNMRDDRRLPFEFHGAVCRLRIELHHENNYMPMEPLTDVVLHLNHTTREGGYPLACIARESARKHLPGSGWCYFDMRHDFPDAWQLLENSCREKDGRGRLAFGLERKMFPYVPALGELAITGMAILFHSADREDCDCESGECPCPQGCQPDCRIVEFRHGRHDRGDEGLRVSCLSCPEEPELYYGIFDTHIGPLGRDHHRAEVRFRFPEKIGELERVYVLCRYERWKKSC
ncbi:MAG: neuraminidase-like domain-containing protein [Candidatus Sulfotelmatobacter sp.]